MVSAPRVMDSSQIWDNPRGAHLPNWKNIRDFFKSEGYMQQQDIYKIAKYAEHFLKQEGNLLYVQDPVVIIGDIHGQYFDMMQMLSMLPDPDQLRYLFLGDYVDRGHYSLEVVLVLLAMKINYPDKVFLLRGNHETRQMTMNFGFRQEVLTKTKDQQLFNIFMSLFDLLPMAAVVNGKYFCVHGGISPRIGRVDEINKLNRAVEVPSEGPFCDLVWSDPVGREDGHQEDVWRRNDARGCSYVFGAAAADNFLRANGLSTIYRGHEAVFDGYKEFRWNNAARPMVCTVFSAPNYTDQYGNVAAIAVVQNDQHKFHQFMSSPHPFHLKNATNVFDYTLPMISTKLSEMIMSMMGKYGKWARTHGTLSAAQVQQYTHEMHALENAVNKHQIHDAKMLNEDYFVDDDGNAINLATADPHERFFNIKLLDVKNEGIRATSSFFY